MIEPRARAIVGSYELVERLGAGGVGEVWKARDRLLNRIVALKFIAAPREGTSPLENLLREARAASALNHPNIITIFEVGEREGTTYLAMEFIDGETLRARMGRGAVPIDEAIDIVTQIVDGLASAHAQGIVHRDLKPENIMLRIDGYVKLVDFGLAKVLVFDDATTGTGSLATQSGQIVGTFSYMSPEQACSQPVSPATDVFALGIVMYELLSGEHPFRRASVLETLNAIVGSDPPRLHAKTPAVPAALADVVTQALQKEPGSRQRSAADLKEPLAQVMAVGKPGVEAAATHRHSRRRSPGIAAAVLLVLVLFVWGVWNAWRPQSPVVPTAPVRSIAVMTFRTDPGDSIAATLAEGLPEDLGGALGAAGLQVVPRSSVVALGPSASPAGAGAALGVDAIVEGTMRTIDNRIRIHLEVVSARTRFQIWSGTFTAAGEELLAGGPIVADMANQLRSGVNR